MAIVGSGPAGFYAAGHLLKASRTPTSCVQVDMFDRLPTPWGLVRAGVAPDHPNIKAVSRVYEKTAEHPGFRFYGNVELGRDLSHEDLADRYHAVVYAVGAQTDRRMGIPGEDLPGSWAATEFVAWYNGHPDYRDLEFDLSAERAVVVGNGNVATDVARMLALTREELAETDIADHALEVLAESNVREIVVLGRRGPAQAAFTNPELLELGEMTDADVFVDPRRRRARPALPRPSSRARRRTTRRRRTWTSSRGYAAREPLGKRRRIVLRFLVSPVEILGDGARGGDPHRATTSCVEDETGAVRARATDDRPRSSSCGLVFRSIGYRGTRLAGRAVRREPLRDPERARPRPPSGRGEYAVGWIKRGPTGIIGTNKRDAQETVDALLEDLDAGRLPTPGDPERDSIEALLAERQPEAVSYAGWQAMDRAEREAGRAARPPAREAVPFDELLEAAKDATRADGSRRLARAAPRRPTRRAPARPRARMQVKIGVSDSV